MADGIITNPYYMEKSADYEITSPVNGHEYVIKNVDSSSHIITFGGNTRTLAQDETIGIAYVNSEFIVTTENIGDVTTDFAAGQAGTSGGPLTRQLGENIYSNGLRIPRLKGKASGNIIYDEKYNSSLSVMPGDWIIIARREAGLATLLDATFQYIIPTTDFGSGAFRVTGRQVAIGSVFDWNFTSLSLEHYNDQYVGRCIIVGSNDTTDRGNYLLIEAKASVTVSFYIMATMANFNIGWELVTPEIWTGGLASGLLPDGSSYATYGRKTDDWWRFGAGETEIWSGNQSIANGASFNIASPVFTGFTNQMFSKYTVICRDGTYYRKITINKPLSQSYASLQTDVTNIASSYEWHVVMNNDANANDFTVYNNTGATIYLLSVVGEM